VAVALVLLGPAALVRRDRWPLAAVVTSVAAADVYIARGYPYGPIFLSVIVSMFVAVRAGRRRETWLLAVLGFAGFVAASVVDPRAHHRNGALHLALVAGWLAVVLAIAEVVRSRADQVAERRRAAAEEKQRLLGEQRLTLARELHDVLAHHISLINVQASVALHLLDQQPERARPALASIKDASRESMHELRTALDVLRFGDEAPRAPAPGLSDLDALVEGVRASGLQVGLERIGAVATLPAAVELAAYRIVQEALTNVTRHAGARTVAIRLVYDHDLTIDVSDDGAGGDVGAGNGITGMRERAAALGGTLDAGPDPGGGFRVVARLPGHPA
jgi:signal transduction histidine kinase